MKLLSIVCLCLKIMEAPLFYGLVILTKRRGGRVVECGGLENRYTACGIGGSNPSLSAILYY